MRRALLIGAGEVGAKHLAALAATSRLVVAAVADPAPRAPLPSDVRLFASWQHALAQVRPELVVVAAPPGIALAAARDAAESGAAVLVEKPVVTSPGALTRQAGDERVFVAFQPHFAPGVAALLAAPPPVVRAEVYLSCRRDPAYFRDWRRTRAGAGGVLHQQAIHGLALALRLMDAPVTRVDADVEHRRGLAETEDYIAADITLEGNRLVRIDARVAAAEGHRHEVLLHTADGGRLVVRGRNLEAGLGALTAAPTHHELRMRMYAAVLEAGAGGAAHPCLFPLSALRRPLEVIDRVYRDARVVRAADAAAA
ncbi:Gfo/Idh/MocA family protein [Streptomyces marincola]|uniref:Gfo/Idh/MocA family protein n=1 Tax=Streptomyces marincola TaxID=2878388 RepID=UPI001CF3E632|nr:Gfo/Idh/MocA family oxidoreductase [Streptomyces marincola]UCM88466.1 Gfo/Idh/MocA family oxidoreductase [Streptomyces marincola]